MAASVLYGLHAPRDVVSSSSYATSNSAYGANFHERFGASNAPLVMRRPKGCEIGSSRPWPAMNEALLSPRVPDSWLLETSAQPKSALALRTDFPQLSSARDASRVASLLISEPHPPLRKVAARPHDAWWSLHIAGDAHGQWTGTGRPSKYGASGEATARRAAGNAALESPREGGD